MELKTVAEVVSSILGLTSTYLLTKGDGRGWILGAFMVCLSAIVFLHASLYGSVAVQGVFLALQLAGLYRWLKGESKDMRSTCRRFTGKESILVLLGWSVAIVALGYFLQWKGGRLPFLDALGTTGNLLAQLVMIAGHPECWLVYMVTNVAYISLSLLSELHVYAVLYSVYMFVALRGWLQWNGLLKEKAADADRSSSDSEGP